MTPLWQTRLGNRLNLILLRRWSRPCKWDMYDVETEEKSMTAYFIGPFRVCWWTK